MSGEWSRTASSWSSQVGIDEIWSLLGRSLLLFMIPLIVRANFKRSHDHSEKNQTSTTPPDGVISSSFDNRRRGGVEEAMEKNEGTRSRDRAENRSRDRTENQSDDPKNQPADALISFAVDGRVAAKTDEDAIETGRSRDRAKKRSRDRAENQSDDDQSEKDQPPDASVSFAAGGRVAAELDDDAIEARRSHDQANNQSDGDRSKKNQPPGALVSFAVGGHVAAETIEASDRTNGERSRRRSKKDSSTQSTENALPFVADTHGGVVVQDTHGGAVVQDATGDDVAIKVDQSHDRSKHHSSTHEENPSSFAKNQYSSSRWRGVEEPMEDDDENDTTRSRDRARSESKNQPSTQRPSDVSHRQGDDAAGTPKPPTLKIRSLEREDLPGLPTYLRQRAISEKIKTHWDAQTGTKKLYKSVAFSSKTLLIVGSLFSFTQGLLSAVGRPLVLRSLVIGLQRGMGTEEAVGLIVFFGLVAFFENWLGVLGRQTLAEEFGTAFYQNLSILIMAKMAKIDPQAILTTSGAKSSKVVPKDVVVNDDNENEEESFKQFPQDDPEDEDVNFATRQRKQRRYNMWNAHKSIELIRKSFRKSKRSGLPPPPPPSPRPIPLEATLLGTDMVRSYENLRAASQLPMAVASIIGGVTVLLLTVGTAGLSGLAVMVFILILNVWISRLSFRLERKNIRMAEERMTIISTVLESIRAIKLFGWEERFMARIEAVRAKEMRGIQKYRISHVTNIASGRISPGMSSMVTLVVFALSGDGTLDVANAFVTVSVFLSLRLALIMMPLGVQSLMAVQVTIERVETYLLSPEARYCDRFVADENSARLLEMKDCTFQLSLDVNVLSNVYLYVNRGESVAVCGAVGSGKTTLLRGALQLIRANPGGSIKSCLRIGYFPQRALLIGGTIRDNILMGRAFNHEAFQRAVRVSQFKRDMDRMTDGAMTQVGERGTTLSGGQAQRLSMCRAVYSQPDLLVLDDPFSAVDAKVCRAMFEACVRGLLVEDDEANSPGILIALNQLSYLPLCSRVAFLHENRIRGIDTFQRLRETDTEFNDFVQAFAEADEDDTAATAQIRRETEDDLVSNDAQANKNDVNDVEKRTQGAVSGIVYTAYFKAFGPIFATVVFAIICGAYATMALNDYWLSLWARAEGIRSSSTPPSSYFAGILIALSCGFAVLILCGSYLLSVGGVRASRSLHNEMIRKVLWAPMSWFETNPMGRVLSRFSGDISRIDYLLSLTMDNASQLLTQLLATIIVVCVVISVYLVPVSILAIIGFAILLVVIDRTLRETKRLANAAMSPLLSNIAESVVGVKDMARAFGDEREIIVQFFTKRHEMASDEYARGNMYSGSLINFAYLQAGVLAFFISIVAATLIVVLKHTYDPALLGLALTYALVIPYLASQSAQSLTSMNMQFTSLERLLEYEHIPQEAPHHLPSDPDVKTWPGKAEIVFENVSARYRPELPLCLNGLSFHVASGEFVGIVGRTGSGKSSTIACLFRIIDPTQGRIVIDGLDIATVGLETLRSRITIIPQEPVLMSGTIRYNLDPFDDHTDEELNESLKRVGMSKRVGLLDVVAKQGLNLSAGERQLLCFARALVLKNRIVVLDEPSSSTDMQTDGEIVKLVQDEFRTRRKCTILTVAHRIETIIQADRCLVMRDGRISDFDRPSRLLRKQNSEFASMVSALGKQASLRMLNLADQADKLLGESSSGAGVMYRQGHKEGGVFDDDDNNDQGVV